MLTFINSKKKLELLLSQLKIFENPSMKLEQYPTPADIAADWIWSMALNGEISGRIILDAGCGPGILGLGLLLMGARKVYFLDQDQKALSVCAENYTQLNSEYDLGIAEFVHSDITLFSEQVDLVVQNPPFGTKIEHQDKIFLEKSFSTAPIVYSMHKWSTKSFVEAVCKDFNYQITHVWQYEFKIKAVFKFHQKAVRAVDVGLWRFEKNK